MIYKFNCKGDNFGVYNEQGELKYTVKLTTEYSFYAEIFDELSVSQLADIRITEKGYCISAFDSPIGLLKKTESGYTTDSGDIKLTDKGERGYFANVLGDTARIAVSGNSVAMQTENEAGVILIVALGLMLLSESRRLQKSLDTITPQEVNSAVHKNAENKTIREIVDMFFTAVGKVVTTVGKSLWENRRAHGKTAGMFVVGIVLSLVLLVSGIISCAVNASKAEKYTKTNATVYVLSKKAIARFSVGGYYYKIDTKPKYKTGDSIPIYYTLDANGRVSKCAFNKPSTTEGIILSVFGVASALTLAFLMFFGLPKLPMNPLKKQDTKTQYN